MPFQSVKCQKTVIFNISISKGLICHEIFKKGTKRAITEKYITPQIHVQHSWDKLLNKLFNGFTKQTKNKKEKHPQSNNKSDLFGSPRQFRYSTRFGRRMNECRRKANFSFDLNWKSFFLLLPNDMQSENFRDFKINCDYEWHFLCANGKFFSFLYNFISARDKEIIYLKEFPVFPSFNSNKRLNCALKILQN